MPDTARPAATESDTIYSLTAEDAAQLYARAGHPRTLRTIQRYCASGHLDCVKAATALGDKYFVDPGSVSRHIAQIEELLPLDVRAAGRDSSRQFATPVVASNQNNSERMRDTGSDALSPVVATQIGNSATPQPDIERDTGRPGTTPQTDLSRPDATHGDAPSRAVEHLEREVTRLEREVERRDEDRDFLRDQIKTKDTQIAALLERDHETNILVRGLQQMLSPLLGGPRREPREQGSERPSEPAIFN